VSNDSNEELTHTDETTGEARMVDVGRKDSSDRQAVAKGRVYVAPRTLRAIRADDIQKGEVRQVSRIAGIMGSKKTSELIPLCHPIPVDGTEVRIETADDPPRLVVTSQVGTHARTGVEMEALTAVSTACLTLYDMCKSIDREMVIGEIFLETKRGGSSGDFEHPSPPPPRSPVGDDNEGAQS
jgi:cyclic pyranopterin phosphate synthase